MEDHNQGELSVTFNCHECGAPAATVTLTLNPDVRSFRVSGFLNEISGGMPKEHYNPFLDALKNKMRLTCTQQTLIMHRFIVPPVINATAWITGAIRFNLT